MQNKLHNNYLKFVSSLVLALIVYFPLLAQVAPVWHTADQKTSSGSSTSLSVAKPGNVSSGNLILLIFSTQRSNSSSSSGFSTPSGFTLIRSEQNSSSQSRPEIVAFYKIATGSEPANYTSTVTNNDYTPNWKALAVRVTGHDPITPIGNNSGTNSTNSSVTSLTIPTLSTTYINSLLVAGRVVRRSISSENTPGGMTLQWSENGTGSSDGNSNTPAMRIATETRPSAGTTGTREFTWSGSARSAGLMFAINPNVSTANLGIALAPGTTTPAYGSNLTFTLTASNAGVANATGVSVAHALPNGYAFVSSNPSQGTYNSSTGLWTVGSVNNGSNATLTITAKVICNGNYNTTASIAGNQTDPVPGNNTANANIVPNGGACPIIAVNDEVTTTQGTPVSFNVLSNDIGPFAPNSFEITSPPSNGTIQTALDGAISYLPNGNFSGTDQFTYKICEVAGNPANCSEATVTIQVVGTFIDPCISAVQAKTYYLPFPENSTQLRKALFSAANINPSGYTMGNNVRTVVSMKMTYPRTIIVYDHWEDGYEANITVPTQSTTQIWGDGKLNNGVAPGYPDDIIPAGGSIVLDNSFAYNNRVQSQIRYDGKDKIFTSAEIALAKVSGDNNGRFNVQSVKTEVLDASTFGKLFVIPFGENITQLRNSSGTLANASVFQYVGLFARSSANGTIVSLDRDGNGTVDIVSPTLNEGEVWFYDGTASQPGVTANINQANDIRAGAIVTSNNPIGVDIVLGSLNLETFATRNISVLPGSYYSSEYYNAVHTTLSTAPVSAVFYNSLATPLTINWTNGSGGSGNLVVPANGINNLVMSATSGYRFVSADNRAFVAVAIVDADNAGGDYDWAYSMIGKERLTTHASVAWAPGSNNGVNNYNPVWVTPVANTTIYVKYDGVLTTVTSQMSPCKVPYDIAIPATALSSIRLFDTDQDQSGLAVYTCDETKIVATYGQDAGAGTPNAGNSLDVGFNVAPKCLKPLIIANDDRDITEPATPVNIPVTSNDVGFLTAINPASITTAGLLQPANGSIIVNPNGIITYVPNLGFTGTDVFDYSICSIDYPNICDLARVTVEVKPCDQLVNSGSNIINGRVFIEQLPDDGLYNVGEAYATGVSVDLYSDINCDGIINGADAIIQTVTTDNSGRFVFTISGSKYAKDNFDPGGGLSGNDGTEDWNANWSNSQGVTVATDPNTGNYALKIPGPNLYASRSMNFSGATGASLKFSYRREGLGNAGEQLTVNFNDYPLMIINDGNAEGTNIFYQQAIINIPTAYINANGTNSVRFETNGNTSTSDIFWIDDVELIQFPECYNVKVNPANTPGKYIASSLNQKAVSFANLGNCSLGNFIGVLAQLDAINDTRTVLRDVPEVIDVLTNDIGYPNPASVSTTGLQQPANGAITVNANGTITYTPNPGYTGTDWFEYRVCSIDDPAVCDVARVDVNITCLTLVNENAILGLIYNDQNQDGSAGTGETGFEGATVKLYNDQNGNQVLNDGEPEIGSVTTGVAGNYQFNIPAPVTNSTVRDNFGSSSYSINNGNANWSTNWTESGETTNSGSGDIQINNGRLRISSTGSVEKHIQRTANLNNATSATLTFDFQVSGFDVTTDIVSLQIQQNGGSWTTLENYTIPNRTGSASFDIGSYISSATAIRFITSSTLSNSTNSSNGGNADYFYVDDFQIAYSTPNNSVTNYLVKLATPLPGSAVQTSTPVTYAVQFTGSGTAVCAKDFGLQQLPIAGKGANSTGNPGGTAQVAVPASTFTNITPSSDPAPGMVTGIRITAFPEGATSIVVNGTSYNGSIVAQVNALLALIIPTDVNGNPAVAISVDPTATGITTVTIPFKAIDNSDASSLNAGEAKLNLAASAFLDRSFIPACTDDKPLLQYRIVTNFNPSAMPAEIKWEASGSTTGLEGMLPGAAPIAEVIENIVIDPLQVSNNGDGTWTINGSLLWPGTVLDGGNNIIDWPGWVLENNVWLYKEDGYGQYRNGATISISINPTATEAALVYPVGGPSCNANPSGYTISGTLFNDPDALTNNKVDGFEYVAEDLFAVLIAPNGNVAGVTPVDGDGNYSFSNVLNGTFKVVITNTAPVLGSIEPSPSYPSSNWIPTGENIGDSETEGNDGAADGVLVNIVVNGADIPGANLGIQERPFAGSGLNNADNPGGSIQIPVPANTFTNGNGITPNPSTDPAPGTITGIRITEFPDGITTIGINNGINTNTYGPGNEDALIALIIPTDLTGAPLWTITVDPTTNGAGTVTIPFKAIDNGGAGSANTGTAILNLQPVGYTISGKVFNDTNGFTDNLVNGLDYSFEDLYAILISNGQVAGIQPIAANGTYSFSNVLNGTYKVLLIRPDLSPNLNDDEPSPAIGSGWQPTGGVIGSGAPLALLSALLTNIVVIDAPVNDINFGIQQPPTAGNGENPSPNPGGTNQTLVPANTFSNVQVSSDVAPGLVTSIRITEFPAGATTIVVNGTPYAAGDVAALTALIIPTNANGEPLWTITVDPIFASNGIGSVVIPFKAIDNAGAESTNNGTAILNFNPDYNPGFDVVGTVHNDTDGLTDNEVDGDGTNAGGLNAILVDNGGVVAGSVTVSPLGVFEFYNVLPGSYSVLLSTNAGTVGQLPPAIVLPANWVSTGEFQGTGAGNDLNVNTILPGIVVADIVNDLHFGIQERPIAGSGANNGFNLGGTQQVTVPANTFTNTTVSSDVAPGTVTSIRIISFPTGIDSIVINGVSYNTAGTGGATAWPAGGIVVPTDDNGNPTQAITVDPSSTVSTVVTIPFKAIDNLGFESLNTGNAVLNLTGTPDLSPSILLPSNTFAPNETKNALLYMVEVSNVPTVAGTATYTVTIPSGYRMETFDNSISSFIPTGGSTSAVNNAELTQISNFSNTYVFRANTAISVNAFGLKVIGIRLTRTTAASGSVSRMTLGIANDATRTNYDSNPFNNTFSRILNAQ